MLVIDEQDNQARLMAIGLRVEGFEAETASSSERALERLSSESFDVAVVDLMLPGTNGIQVARLVRDRHPRTRVVLMSAYHLSERQLARADCGATGFVPKPLDLGELAAFLEGKARLAPSLRCAVLVPRRGCRSGGGVGGAGTPTAWPASR